MRIKKFMSPLLMAATVSLFSCINNDYDLSDIDSTVGVNVKDLTVPINLDGITLDAMLDLDDDSQIKKVNGEYAIVESGVFHSEQIHVPSFTIIHPYIKPIEDEIGIEIDVPTDYPMGGHTKTRATENERPIFSYKISEAHTEINLHEDAEGVSDFIVSIDKVGVEDADRKGKKAEMKMVLSFDGLANFANELEIENLKIQFLPGLIATFSAGTYNKELGVLNVGNMKTTNYKLQLDIYVEGIDSDAKYEFVNGSFNLKRDCKVLDGASVAIYPRDLTDDYFNEDKSLNLLKLATERPSKIDYKCVPMISNISVTTFTGKVKYDIDGIDISPVELNDIPDVLNQTGTKIMLDNPQIYLQLNNPVKKYNLTANANLKITSYVNGVPSSYSPDNGKGVSINKTDNKFCLSPKQPDAFYVGDVEGDNGELIPVDFTAGTDTVHFTSLSKVLCGDGDNVDNIKLPETIAIDVVNPEIATQEVVDFKLGEDLGGVDGEWVFYAPLSLTKGSQIKYTDTFDGWNDEDIDAVVISELTLNAYVTTDIPLDLDVKAYPIDINGNKILDAEGEPVIGTAKVNHASDKTPLEIKISGEIKHLDGIILDAYVLGANVNDGNDNLPLEPTQTIKLDNIKVKVSGTYEKEL